MKLEDILDEYNNDRLTREQALFTSIFVIQNRIQTAGEKIQNELSMKQWLLITIISVCPKPHTLTNIGRMMGCSRQNVKKLVRVLEEKGYIKAINGSNNSLFIELTAKVNEYSKIIGHKQIKFLKLLFSEFSNDEIISFFNMTLKLYSGLKRIEEGAGVDYE